MSQKQIGALGLLTIFLSASPAIRAADAPEPLRGAVYKGMILSCVLEDKSEILACLAPVGKDGSARRVMCAYSTSYLLRWHIGHGHLWPLMIVNEGPKDRRSFWMFGLQRYRLPELLDGKLLTAPGAEEGKVAVGTFAPADPVRDGYTFCGLMEFDASLHFDYLPMAEDRTLIFVLTDARGRFGKPEKGGELVGQTIEITDEEAKTPRWSFTAYEFSGATFDPKRMYVWDGGRWKKSETLQVSFRERFQAFGQGDDYYFVTASGKLYRSPRPTKKDEERKVEAVWDDATRPITAFVTDANVSRTFLFCEPAKGSKKPAVYFEASAKPVLYEYDPTKVGGDVKDVVKRINACARVLLNGKHIKAE